MAAVIKKGSRLAPLIMPLVRTDHAKISKEFAQQVSEAVMYMLLEEGERAIDYITKLPEDQKKSLIDIFTHAGVENVLYVSRDRRVQMSRLK